VKVESQKRLRDILDALQKDHQVKCTQKLTLGNICSHIYRGLKGKEAIVVKIGIGEAEVREIRNNMEGYLELERIGARSLAPERIDYFVCCGTPVIVMTDCGQDFWHATKSAVNPVDLYHRLVRGIEPIYKSTKRPSEQYTEYLESVKEMLLRQYDVHLSDYIDSKLVRKLRREMLTYLHVPYTCFSSFDFTPEDVFVTASGIKYADPKPGMTGIPIIDLACFAGVARDAHALPGCNEGYEILSSFAVNQVAKILDIGSEDANRIFSLGRSLQCAFSARFRLETDLERALIFIKQSEIHLELALGGRK